MTYDFIGERLEKIRSFIEAKQYYLASLELIKLLELFRPGTTEYVKLIHLAEWVAIRIEDVDQKARVLLMLTQHLRQIDYREHERVVSEILSLLPLIRDEDLKHEIYRKLEVRAQEGDKHALIKKSTDWALGELNRLKSKLHVNPYIASELEAFYVKYEKQLDDKVKKVITSLLDRYPPEITTEIEFSGSNTIAFPSDLEFKIKLLNKGYRTANDIKFVVKLDSPYNTEEHLINPIAGSSLKLRPRELREFNIRVPLRKLGRYSVSVDIIYYDAVRKEYRDSIKVLEDLNVITASVSEISKKDQLDVFNKARVELVQHAYCFLNEVAKLCDAILDNRSEKEIIDHYRNLVKDLELNFFNKLRDLLSIYKDYAKSCSSVISFYERIIPEVEKKVKSLKEISNEKVVEKPLLSSTIELSRNVHNFLRELVNLVFEIVLIEDAERIKSIYVKLIKMINRDSVHIIAGLNKEERNLIILKYSFSSEEPGKTLEKYNKLKGAHENLVLMKRYEDDLKQSIEFFLKKLEELKVEYKC
ncbi:MAG: hypothetical protein QXH34_06440 [Ignisphaera sp.]